MRPINVNTPHFTTPNKPQEQLLPNKLTPIGQISVCKIEELEAHYRNSSDIVGDICQDHESLIKTILEEEEEIV
jgi:hypothetical protein